MKKEIVAAGMAGVLTFTGVGSAFATPTDTDSIAGGNKRVILKDENPDRYNDALRNLGVDISLFTSSEIKEQVKTTSTRKVIVQIGENFCLVSDPNVSGENNVLKENDTCPEIINNRTMVPLRFISEALGATVDWNGENQSISLKKSNKEIGMQIGNNLMKVNTNGDVKESFLDSPPTVNKDNRTLVPVRAIAEAFGIEVQWDGKTNSVFIGYTEAEKNSLLNSNVTETEISADAIDLSSSYQASRFMAGGEYMNVAEEGPFAIKDKQSGAAVVFSDKDFLDIDGTISLIERSKYNAEELHQRYIDKSIINSIKDKLNSNDCVYVLNGEAYVFNDENLKQGNKTLVKYDVYGNPSTITNEKAGIFYFSRLAFDKNLGVCVFNGTKITHKLNTQTKQFDELSAPEFVGTLEQRTIHNLEAAYNGSSDTGSINVSNPLGLNYQDILEYKNTGSDVNCKSFKLIKVSDNLGFICLIGGQCGLQNEKNLENLKLAVQECNKIDPIIAQNWVNRGLDFFAINELQYPVFEKYEEGFATTYNPHNYGGIIFFHENLFPIPVGYMRLFSLIEEESNGLKYRYHLFEGWIFIINGVVYNISEEDYKKEELKKTRDKYFHPNKAQ
jgi:hypothetical protein